MRVIIAGVPGAGKTTVMKEALKKIDMEIINYGDIMFNMAKERKLVKNRDELRKLNLNLQRELQIMAAQKIAEKENVIVDTHCTIKTKGGYMPGLPHNVLQILKPSLIILVEADPQEIMKRRKKDEGIRDRDEEEIAQIEEHQHMNRISAMVYASLINATVKIIRNEEGKIEEAGEEILKAIMGGGNG